MKDKAIHLIAGANGVGKTSFAREFLPRVGTGEFLNADLLAAGLSPLKPEAAGMAAGRLLLGRWKKLVNEGISFGFESTLSGRSYAKMLRQAMQEGYAISLHYLWVPGVEICLERVKQRVRQGGHHVPEGDVRRRFLRSLENFFVLYLPLADEVRLWDVGANPSMPVADWRQGKQTIYEKETYERIREQASNGS